MDTPRGAIFQIYAGYQYHNNVWATSVLAKWATHGRLQFCYLG